MRDDAYLSDVLPTAWQAVEYAAIPPGGSVVVFGLGPIGDMCCRVALEQGARMVIGVDLVPERLERARARGVETLDLGEHDDVPGAIRSMTAGRGADSVIDAVGMEAHGSPAAELTQKMTQLLPDAIAAWLMKTAGTDRMSVLQMAIAAVRRGGTISLSGVYAGMQDPLPMQVLFDKQIQLRMGQANVRRWVDDILSLLTRDDDPLGVEGFATHRMPLAEAPEAYASFQEKRDGVVKVLFEP